jgi:hypothetical protein
MSSRIWQVAVLVLGAVVVWQFTAVRSLETEAASARTAAAQLREENDRMRSILHNRPEIVDAGVWLHNLYRSDQGLKRPQGLWIGDQPDFEGIGAWLIDVYLSERIAGGTIEAARQKVVDIIQQTDEWRQKHPGQ